MGVDGVKDKDSKKTSSDSESKTVKDSKEGAKKAEEGKKEAEKHAGAAASAASSGDAAGAQKEATAAQAAADKARAGADQAQAAADAAKARYEKTGNPADKYDAEQAQAAADQAKVSADQAQAAADRAQQAVNNMSAPVAAYGGTSQYTAGSNPKVDLTGGDPLNSPSGAGGGTTVTQAQIDEAAQRLPEGPLSRPPIDPATQEPVVQSQDIIDQNVKLQGALYELGYVAEGHQTGTFGSITEGAIKAFQYEHGLEVTGEYDQDTKDAMAVALAEKAAGITKPVDPPPAEYVPITDEQLAAIMPNSTPELRETYLQPLNDAMKEFNINTPERQAAFLAQVSKETGDLQFMSELGDATKLQEKYGNYQGRGMLQLTWENNYKAAGEALGEDLTTDPSVVATDPDLAARTAAWFFSNKGLNEVADQGQIGRVTLLINGGYNGIDDRLAAYDRAMKALAPPEQPLALAPRPISA